MNETKLNLMLEAAKEGLVIKSKEAEAAAARLGAPVPLEEQPDAGLTGLERAVLRGLRAGRTQVEIARQKHHSRRTIYSVSQRLRARFGAATNAELVIKTAPGYSGDALRQ